MKNLKATQLLELLPLPHQLLGPGVLALRHLVHLLLLALEWSQQ
jgi:hypothetical protein